MRSRSGRLRRFGLCAASLLLILGLWEITALTVSYARDVAFPTPWSTAVRLVELIGGGRLLGHSIARHTLDSLARWVAGFSIAGICGMGFGLAAGWWPMVERLTMPLVHVLQLIPGLAWIPVAILIFGIGEKATVFMIAMTAFTPVAINVTGGVKRVDVTYVRAARMLGARHRTIFFRVLIPGALPHILSGLRIGLGNGWRVLVASEMIVGTGTGLGYSIIQARWTLDYASAFVCIFVICVVGLIVERVVFATWERYTVERWGLTRAA